MSVDFAKISDDESKCLLVRKLKEWEEHHTFSHLKLSFSNAGGGLQFNSEVCKAQDCEGIVKLLRKLPNCKRTNILDVVSKRLSRRTSQLYDLQNKQDLRYFNENVEHEQVPALNITSVDQNTHCSSSDTEHLQEHTCREDSNKTPLIAGFINPVQATQSGEDQNSPFRDFPEASDRKASLSDSLMIMEKCDGVKSQPTMDNNDKEPIAKTHDHRKELQQCGDIHPNPGPGLKAVPVEEKGGLKCVHCGYLLKNPVQTEDGVRLCKECCSEIQSMPGACSDCGIFIDKDSSAFPDRAVARELAKLQVYCAYKSLGCGWKGPLKEWEAHCEQCDFKGVKCTHKGCEEIVEQGKLEDHKLVCQYRLENCTYCGLEMIFNEIQRHQEESCDEYPVSCDIDECTAKFPRKQLQEHRLKYCIIEECLICHKKVYRATGKEVPNQRAKSRVDIDGDGLTMSNSGIVVTSSEYEEPVSKLVSRGRVETDNYDTLAANNHPAHNIDEHPVHLSVPLDNFRHHQIQALKVQELQIQVNNMTTELHKKSQDISEGHLLIQNQQQEIATLKEAHSKQQSLIQAMEVKLAQLEEQQQIAMRKPVVDKNMVGRVDEIEKRSRRDDLKKQITTVKASSDKNATELHELQLKSRVPPNTGQSLRHTSGRGAADVHYGNVLSESRFIQLEHRVEDLARNTSTTRAHVQELEIQLQAQVAATYNGSCLWRIPDVAKRRRDALEDRILSIYSPAFYTGRYGYKMCHRMYLNGDGMDLGSHISVFFVVMRGDYDALLKWPFEHKVSLILVDNSLPISRHGYNIWCRKYLNGDSEGLGTHPHTSMFFAMRGDYDALLKWPFEQHVSLLHCNIIDQNSGCEHTSTDTMALGEGKGRGRKTQLKNSIELVYKLYNSQTLYKPWMTMAG